MEVAGEWAMYLQNIHDNAITPAEEYLYRHEILFAIFHQKVKSITYSTKAAVKYLLQAIQQSLFPSLT